jgi:DNA-binding transcriptional MocR family regulator
VTFGGAGLGFLASSPTNVAWYVARARRRSIGPDKLNQLRHVRFLRDAEGLDRHMEAHRAILAPKFKAVVEMLDAKLGDIQAARWTRPEGGYFITLEVMDGCAKRVVELAAQAGVAMTPAGATYPYGRDPHDRTLRIAPSYPRLEELSTAAEGIAICVLIATTELLLEKRSVKAAS